MIFLLFLFKNQLYKQYKNIKKNIKNIFKNNMNNN